MSSRPIRLLLLAIVIELFAVVFSVSGGFIFIPFEIESWATSGLWAASTLRATSGLRDWYHRACGRIHGILRERVVLILECDREKSTVSVVPVS